MSGGPARGVEYDGDGEWRGCNAATGRECCGGASGEGKRRGSERRRRDANKSGAARRLCIARIIYFRLQNSRTIYQEEELVRESVTNILYLYALFR